MKKLYLRIIAGICLILGLSVPPAGFSGTAALFHANDYSHTSESYFPDSIEMSNFPEKDLYASFNFTEDKLSRNAFEAALNGHDKLFQQGKIENPGILTVIDFSKPSTEKRLFVLDLENQEILFETYVSHGQKSGGLYARNFSNVPQSHKSSLGFFVTGETYHGKHGYSLKLVGLERGINDNAYRRAIVIHGAKYVSEKYIDAQGFIGRSFGCPALPMSLTKPIIEKIKEGSCLFIYYPSSNYLAKSSLVKR